MAVARPCAERSRAVRSRLRFIQALSGVAIVGVSIVSSAAAAASPDSWCAADLGGSWNGQDGVCSAPVRSERNATVGISASSPPELQADPTAGPVINAYLKSLVDGWRNTARQAARDGTYTVDYRLYSYRGMKSVVFHEFWQTLGMTPNDAYRTFTFDLARGEQLTLANLFKPGVDPVAALPSLVRPYLTAALDQASPQHDPGSYPFTTERWEPQPDGSGYSGSYRAFAISDDELILYMPDAPMAHENPFPRDRFVWSMDGGAVVVRVPLAALAPGLR
jgi:hypothetical protein